MDIISYALGKKGMQQSVSDYLDEHLTNPTNPPIDTSLTIAGAAADSKETGNRITDLKEDLSDIYYVQLGENLCNPSTETIGSLKTDGSVDATATSYKTSDFIDIDQNSTYTLTEFRTSGSLSTSRKYCALYDQSRTFISGSYQNVSPAGSLTIQTGNAKFLRVSSTATNTRFVKLGETAPTRLVEYYKNIVSKLNYDDGTIPVSALDEEVVGTSDVNLYTGENEVVGVINSVGNIDSTATLYKTTEPIAVKKGVTYFIAPRLRMYAFYSGLPANSSSFIVLDTTEKTTAFEFTSEYDGYMRVSYNTTYPLTFIESSYDGEIQKKIEEGIGTSETIKNQLQSVVNRLYKKKWAVCGDSFTNDGGTGTKIAYGKYAGKSYTYPWIIGNRHNMDIVKFFEGGRTLAFPAVPDTFVNSLTNPNADWFYQNIPSDVDFITIYLGINDEHHAPSSIGGDGEDNTGIIPLGTIDDDTTATYYGAWNVVLTWLIINRPNAHIGIIVTNGIANNDNYRLAQIAIAKKYGIPYIDMNGDERTPAMLRTSNPNIPAEIKAALIQKWSANYPSNQHPNDDAQLFESHFIENFLRSI